MRWRSMQSFDNNFCFQFAPRVMPKQVTDICSVSETSSSTTVTASLLSRELNPMHCLLVSSSCKFQMPKVRFLSAKICVFQLCFIISKICYFKFRYRKYWTDLASFLWKPNESLLIFGVNWWEQRITNYICIFLHKLCKKMQKDVTSTYDSIILSYVLVTMF